MPVRFSVIVPTHDRRETLLLALRSALAQTQPPSEVIVVADGCTDGSADAARALHPSIEVIERPKAAGYGWENRTAAVERATGDAIAWLGDDDLWLPWHLERLAGLYEHDVADFVTASCVRVTEDDELISWGMDLGVEGYRAQMAPGRVRVPSTAVSHRPGLVARAGGWREVESFGDLDLWRRMLEAGARTASVAEPSGLVFTAWERRQTWPERVAQNARWAGRIGDPGERERLRAEMSLAVDRERWSAEAADAIVADRDAARAERDHLAARLAGIEASRWWRLRNRLKGRR